MFFLVIKGNVKNAYHEAGMNGISIKDATYSEKNDETYCYADNIFKKQIIDWYAKDAGIAAPYQKGSLLWYADRNKGDVRDEA